MERKKIDELIKNYPALSPCAEEITDFTAALERVFLGGGTLYLCGNGGSAADCSHIEAELTKAFIDKKKVDDKFCAAAKEYGAEGEKLVQGLEAALPVVALPTRIGVNTAFANDADAALVYAQAVYALGKGGDALLAISTSGNSENCIYALIAAAAKGMTTFLLTGKTGGKAAKFAHRTIRVPSDETVKIQELHLPVYHAICAALEDIKR